MGQSQSTYTTAAALISIVLIVSLAPFEAQSQTETASNSSPPTVTSIERSSPAQQDTDSQSLVFEVNFSEPVAGVDPADFVLSQNNTMPPRQFVHTSEPALAMPDNGPAVSDAITVDSSGPAASVRVEVDITHAYRQELKVSLMAPDGTGVVLHDQTGDGKSDLHKTYAPDFGGIEMNGVWNLFVTDAYQLDSGMLNSWTLTIDHADSGDDDAVSGVAGSGAQYFVTVPAARDGTYNLDLVADHGIADMAGRPLNDTAPTESDQSYVVYTGPPAVASIARHNPAQQDTDSPSLVFEVAFSEPVIGVDTGDFALSVDGSMTTDLFERTSAPALAIPNSGPAASDAITVDVSGTVVSVRADVDITHPYTGDLQVDLISPDGTVVTLHDHGGIGTANLHQTYTPDFGNLRMDGDWTLRVGDIWEEHSGTLNSWTLAIDYIGAPESVTGLSGAQYLVAVPATRNGTYNLDVIQNSRITDMAGNPLDGTTQTRDDQSYNVTMTVAPATPVNTPPTADAGPDQTVQEGGGITLNGQASDDDGDPLTYAWSHDSSLDIVFGNSAALFPTVTVPQVDANATVTVTLTADDGTDTASDTFELTITDVPLNNAVPFVTTWRTTTPDGSITIPVGGATGTYTIDWGDGTTSTGVSGGQTHTYAESGDHMVSISGDFTRIHLDNQQPNAGKLLSIDRWGDMEWSSMNSAFEGASNMVYNATDIPNLSGATDISSMFYGAASFDGDLSDWDVSGATDMSYMFYQALEFDGDLSDWDVSGATDMSYMFYQALEFDGDLSDWDTSDVANMAGMFQKTYAFNGDLSGWNTSNVSDMADMFQGAAAFNGDLSGWNTSGVTDMSFMFNLAAKFNGDLSDWDTSDVANMAGMFWNAAKFNGDISGWDTSGVTDMTYMFNQDSVFSGDLSGWNTSNVTNMAGMFQDASRFRSNLSNWDTSEVTDMRGMFARAYVFNGDISGWDVSAVTNMATMFWDTYAFNGDISGWDVSAVTDMTGMLSDARAFDQNLGLWYVIPADTYIDEGDATRFVTTIDAKNDALRNQGVIYGIGTGGDSASFDIANGNQLVLLETPHYDTQSSYTVNVTSTGFGTGNHHRVLDVTVTDNDYQPADADSFITTWATVSDDEIITFSTSVAPGGDIAIYWGDGTAPSNVTAARQQSHEYAVAGSYTVAISGDLERFYFYSDDDASALRSLDQWGDMKWSSMSDMFYGAFDMEYLATDTPDLSGVTDMGYTFSGAEKFNGDLSGWDTSAVTNMADMFYGATEFDGDLSGWNVSSATDMSGMFDGAHSFDQNLGNWYIVLDDATARYGNTSVTVGSIAAQNAFLDGQNLSYLVGTGGDSGSFELRGTDLILNSPAAPSVTKNSYTVNVTSTGEFGTDNSKILDITINNPPVVNAGTDQTAPEGTVVTLNGTASDADGDPLTYSWIQTAGEAATLSGDDTLSPTFTAPHVLSDTILVFDLTAGDGTFNPTDTVEITILDVPDQFPTVTSIERSSPAQQNTDSQLLVFGVTFSGPVTGVDLADFVLSPDSTGSGSMSALSGSGSTYNVTVAADTSGTYNLDVIPDSGIVDANNNPLAGTAPLPDQSFVVEIVSVDPVLDVIPDQTVDELSVLSFVAGVANDELLSPPLTYGLVGGLAGATMNPATGTFDWTPAETQNGIHTVTVTVTDARGNTGSQQVGIMVNEVNTAPVLDAIPGQAVDSLSALTFVASAADGDRHPAIGVERVAGNLKIRGASTGRLTARRHCLPSGTGTSG